MNTPTKRPAEHEAVGRNPGKRQALSRTIAAAAIQAVVDGPPRAPVTVVSFWGSPHPWLTLATPMTNETVLEENPMSVPVEPLLLKEEGSLNKRTDQQISDKPAQQHRITGLSYNMYGHVPTGVFNEYIHPLTVIEGESNVRDANSKVKAKVAGYLYEWNQNCLDEVRDAYYATKAAVGERFAFMPQSERFTLFRELVKLAPYQVCSCFLGPPARSLLDLEQIFYGDADNEVLEDWKDGLTHLVATAFEDFHIVMGHKEKSDITLEDRKAWIAKWKDAKMQPGLRALPNWKLDKMPVRRPRDNSS